ncbi:S1 family peptidase [Afipia sp. TerB]
MRSTLNPRARLNFEGLVMKTGSASRSAVSRPETRLFSQHPMLFCRKYITSRGKRDLQLGSPSYEIHLFLLRARVPHVLLLSAPSHPRQLVDDQYRALVNNQLRAFPDFAKRERLLETGYFLGSDLVQLVHASGDGSGTAVHIVGSLLDQLIEWMLVVDAGVLVPNGLMRYQWNKPRIAQFIALHILDNVLLGPTYVAQKYRQSVPPVFVRKGEDDYTGTGFLVTNRGDQQKFVVVTAKHNVDPADGITFVGFGSAEDVTYTSLADDWILHPTLDIALMPVACSKTAIPIYPVGDATALSRTITLGYPRIATTDAPYLLAHGGEINAVVSDYYGEQRLIISNIVAPGNSGGPVLNEAGLCVGMVVNAFETSHQGGVSVANAAILSGPILEFITPYLTGPA